MKVTMTEAICQKGMALLEGKGEIFVAHDAYPHNYLDQLRDTDAFIVRVAGKGAIDKETMESSPALKAIGRTGIGYDSVDVEAATRLGIPVVITPGANNRSVAEHAVALMLRSPKTWWRAMWSSAGATERSRTPRKSLRWRRKPASSSAWAPSAKSSPTSAWGWT